MNQPILVLGATGAQGGATVTALLARGRAVRALTRKPDGPAAQALAARGVEVVAGDMDDADSLRAALRGCAGVFSVQNIWEKGNDEAAQGRRVADLAKEAGVGLLVQASVARADDHPDLEHFACKWEVEQHLHGLGLPYTILRPVYFMDNLVHPSYGRFHWTLIRHFVAGGRLQMIACADIGEFAARAFDDPAGYAGRTITLAGDDLGFPGAAAAYTAAFGAPPRPLPLPGFFLESFKWFQKEVWKMFDWYRQPVFHADIAALRAEHPGLRDLPTFFAERAKG